MEIILKSDWDFRLQPPLYGLERKGYFAGRKDEIEHLVKDILRKENGAIAISGYRGVGKTSLVYYALHEVRQRLGNEKSIIVVLINAAQLETESENLSIKIKIILTNLIRRLYSTIEYYKIEKEKKEKKEIISSKINWMTQILKSTFRINSEYLPSSQEKKFLFSWDEIPGNDNSKLIEFLKQKFEIDWVKTARIKKNDNGNTIKVSTEINHLSLNLNQKKTQVIFIIDDGRIDKFIAKMENGKLNIYENGLKIYKNKEQSININKDLEQEIEILYRKAVSVEFITTEYVSRSNLFAKEIIEEKKFEVTSVIKIFFNPFVMFSGFVGAILVFNEPILNNPYIIPIGIAAVFSSPLLNFLYRRNQKNKQQDEIKKNVEACYKFDNCVENLEFDLEKIHRDISSQEKIKLIYVIDEMDKLDLQYGMDIISYFKNFFTLTNAYFIFINGEKMHNMGKILIEDKKQIHSTLENDNKTYPEKEYRPKEYTYFTSRYFLSRPLTRDLDDFFDAIVDNIEDVKDHEEFKYFKRALYFDAQNDFFDIKTCINDKIIGKSIQYSKDDLVSINDVKKARFHSIVTCIFERHFMYSNPTQWQNNELLLRNLFVYAREIYFSDTGTKFLDPVDDTDLSEAKRDFNTLLFRNGAFTKLESNEIIIKGSPVTINKYEYFGAIPNEPECHVKTDITEYEKRYRTKFEEYSNYINLLYNVFLNTKHNTFNCPDKFKKPSVFEVEETSKWGFSTRSQFDTYSSIYSVITMEKQIDSKDNLSRREKIIPNTEELSKHINILVNDLPKTIALMIRARHLNKDLIVQSLKEKLSFPAIFTEELHNFLQNFNSSVVSNKQENGVLTRQLLIINNKPLNDEKETEQFTNETIEQIRNEIKKNATTHRVVIITDISMPNSDGVYIIQNKSPKEFCEELSSFLKKNKDKDKDIKRFISGEN